MGTRVCQRAECDNILSSTDNRTKYCSNSCAAKVNNILYPKRTAIKTTCPECKKPTRKSNKYGHKKCYESIRQRNNIDLWLSGKWNGNKGNSNLLSLTIRNYLIKQSNYQCSKCKFNTVHPDDGKTILEINHINGNGTDHNPSNLEVLCPNCHALTSSYRGRNIGNGRPVYYYRIIKDQ